MRGMDRRSVAVFPLLPGERWRVLLLRRIPERGGFWQPVTGSVEAGESLEDAALRELREETGLPAERLVDLGLEATFTGFDGHRYHERAFAAVVATDAFVRSAEHDDARLVPLGEAEELLRWEENRVALRAAKLALGAA